MRARIKGLICLLLCLLLCGCAESSPAAESSGEVLPASLPERRQRDYEPVAVYIGGLLLDEGFEEQGQIYISPQRLCSSLDIQWSWQGDEKDFSLLLEGHEFSGSREDEYLSGRGRYFYAPEGWLYRGGELYISAELLSRLLCLEPERRDEGLWLATEKARVIPGGSDYYEANYPYEDLFWLSQMISAEASTQPMAGMIGVGNVILNRVKSEIYPDSVFDVIFDTEYQVQFQPIANGTIYDEVSRRAYIAACLCLDGYNTVGESLYFVNPDYGSEWFDASLTLEAAIGEHNFYSEGGA